MFIDKEGKIFGKISLIDILAIFISIIIYFGICARLNFKLGKPISKEVNIEFKIKLNEIKKCKLEALKNSKIIYDYETNEKIGEILNIKENLSLLNEKFDDGTIVQLENPKLYDAILTIKSNCKADENCYKIKGNKKIGIGRDLYFRTKYCVVNCKIIDIKETNLKKND
ncbi:MAG: DUF4330 domain-containing protein [Clostridiales bacterium]|jgi:hypothetical protein|nr:DUF4330 domain-containing protein [Clostridiales bacterium]